MVNQVVCEQQRLSRELPVDFEGLLKKIAQEKIVQVSKTVSMPMSYTVTVPVTSCVTQDYVVTLPVLRREAESAEQPATVVQFSLPDLNPIGQWTPEGDRQPVGTSFNADGSRIFVTTLSGISVLESQSMIELVDIRERDSSGKDVTQQVHHLSPFYLAQRDALLTPTLSQLVTLESNTKPDADYFDSLADSAKTFKQQSLELAQAAAKSALTAPAPMPSPGTNPQPTAQGIKPALKPLLAKVEADKQEVPIAKYNYSELGLDEPVEMESKVYQMGQFDHHDVIVADAPHSTTIPIPDGFASFTTFFGLQDKHNGSVTFVIRGDGKTLYRSSIIRDHVIHGITLDIRGVKQLELAVEIADKEGVEDKALWVDPTLYRQLSPDVYPVRFEELHLKIEKYHHLDFSLDRNGLEKIGLLSLDPEIKLLGRAWKPKEVRNFREQVLIDKLKGDLDFSRARIHFIQKPLWDKSVSYSYQNDQLRVQCFAPLHTSPELDLIIQIPYQVPGEDNISVEPQWTGKWRLAVWSYPAEAWNSIPQEVPPKETKPLAVTDVESLNWDWYDNEPTPFKEVPNDHFVIIGERKFESGGGTYRIESVTDDGVRVKLDDEVIIDNWTHQAVTQNAVLVNIAPGMHKIRVEYFDAIRRSRLGVSIRCIDPKGTELKRFRASDDVTAEDSSDRQKTIDHLRSIGVYLFEELNAPEPKIFGADLTQATGEIDTNTMTRLLELQEIHTLAVGRNQWTDKDWERLVNLKSLERLTIDYNAIQLEEFKSIASLKQLKRLSILGNNFGDEQLEQLTSMSNLRVLGVWHAKLTDDCFESLAKMPNLREFFQGGMKITEAAMNVFKERNAVKNDK